MSAPSLSTDDRLAIHELLNLHGHLCDRGELDRFEEVFAIDLVCDLSAFGYARTTGVDAVRDAAIALGDGNPVAHHVTNIVVTPLATDRAAASSKGIGIQADGTIGSVVYDDVVVRTAAGWRITERTITPRRQPLTP
jgi:hypothetical protein